MVKVILTLVLSTSLFATTQDKKELLSTTDDTHTYLSESITKFATTIDSFFADDNYLQFENKTRLRFFTDTLFSESTPPSTIGDFRFQLQLPGIQKRLQLVLEKEQDTDLEEEKINPVDNNQRNDTAAGLRLLLDSPKIKTSLATGLIFRSIKPLLFTRLRLRKNIGLDKWIFRPEQEVRWVDTEGVNTSTDLTFDYQVQEDKLFRFVNNFTWNDTEFIIDIENGPSLFHQITSKIGMSYNFRLLSSDSPKLSVNDYVLSVGYRQLLYKKWFFWTLSPALSFPRINRFKRTPTLNIRFEIIIGHI